MVGVVVRAGGWLATWRRAFYTIGGGTGAVDGGVSHCSLNFWIWWTDVNQRVG